MGEKFKKEDNDKEAKIKWRKRGKEEINLREREKRKKKQSLVFINSFAQSYMHIFLKKYHL